MVVLRRVCDNSDTNEMTSYNVAACVAQCLLWPPTHLRMCSEGQLAAAKQLNQVVQKMIEGSVEIFGADALPFLPAQLCEQRSVRITHLISADLI